MKHVTDLLDGLPHLFLPLAEPLINELVTAFETPIQFRQALYQGNACYNTVAMYHPTALDSWGSDDKRICVDKFTSDIEKDAHEQVAVVYAFAYSAILNAPGCKKFIVDIMENFLKLPMNKLDDKPDLGTPWGLAKATVDKMYAYAQTDGWNADGALTHNFNKMPFSDFNYKKYSAYQVLQGSYINSEKDQKRCNRKWNWEPLLETDGKGYFTKQEHVTPFAGFTGRLYGLTNAEYRGFSIPKPKYNYCEEVEYVLSKTKNMATNDKMKVEIEFFDSKFTSLLPMQIDWTIKNNFSLFDFWFYDMALVTAMYDAIMVVWREKVAFNTVRPTTVVHTMKGDKNIKTYAGPFEGSQRIKGGDWMPYVRTMPHAEYPSGSSCICTAYAEVMQQLTGKDKTGLFPVGRTFEAGSLRSEPGVAPIKKIDLVYSTWSEVQHTCGQSRLNGGMHFSKAIPAGEELCTGLAYLIVGRANLLKAGDANGALADFNDTSITVKWRRNVSKKR